MTQVQGKSILVGVSARFVSAGVSEGSNYRESTVYLSSHSLGSLLGRESISRDFAARPIA